MGIFTRIFNRYPRITPGGLENDELTGLVGKPDPFFLEIGCNDGGHTQRFLKLFPGIRIHCFEPDPRAIGKFRNRIQDERVTLITGAVSDHDGEAQFHISDGLPQDTPEMKERFPDGWDLSGSLKEPSRHLQRHPWCTFKKKISVRTMTLDTWLRKHDPGVIDFIWADTQGGEADLIRGGQQTLARTRYFYTEYSNRQLYRGQAGLKQLITLLPDFTVVHRYPNDVLFRNRNSK